MDSLAIVNECRQQAAHCRTRAETASDERVRALLVSMALIWTKLAEEAESIQRNVDYRCDECGAEVLRAVPLGR
jgi:hypothetical protein